MITQTSQTSQGIIVNNVPHMGHTRTPSQASTYSQTSTYSVPPQNINVGQAVGMNYSYMEPRYNQFSGPATHAISPQSHVYTPLNNVHVPQTNYISHSVMPPQNHTTVSGSAVYVFREQPNQSYVTYTQPGQYPTLPRNFSWSQGQPNEMISTEIENRSVQIENNSTNNLLQHPQQEQQQEVSQVDETKDGNNQNIKPPQEFNCSPRMELCPNCNEITKTVVRLENNFHTHAGALIMYLLGCVCCWCIPYCTDWLKTCSHYCSKCNNYIGSCKKLKLN
ncbi:uncharacterized protein LOC129607422 [Condylostylus longicornis]|uniref:uncharacterized protein LOC129607422 n=1 Tax=Condylostylus longicornis TaxID=2530218 RepID=UPI00244DFD45|nr:uncharacterized protein LOC129607422 [Condylostylus longicornis]